MRFCEKSGCRGGALFQLVAACRGAAHPLLLHIACINTVQPVVILFIAQRCVASVILSTV